MFLNFKSMINELNEKPHSFKIVLFKLIKPNKHLKCTINMNLKKIEFIILKNKTKTKIYFIIFSNL